MTDRQTYHGFSDTAKEVSELNKVSQPLGYAVTGSAGVEFGVDAQPDRRFMVHRVDQLAGTGPSFETSAEVGAYLDELAKLPREQPGRYEGASHLSVATENPPTIGQWYKSGVA